MTSWNLSLTLWCYIGLARISDIHSATSLTVVVGGNAALPKQFPMAARLSHHSSSGNQTKWFCGGTLISHQVVLTAAHCFYSDVGIVNIVRLGELVFDTEKDDAEPEDIEVLEIKAHPNFRYPIFYNDIGLVRLRKQVTFGPYKMPACLPSNGGEQLKSFTAIGWGQQRFDEFEPSKELREVELQNYNRSCSDTTYPSEDCPQGYHAESQLCVGSPGHKDTCNGDSGGPLLIAHTATGCRYQVMGVTSVGLACDTPDIPSLYTRVHYFGDWIKAELANTGRS